MSLEEHVPKELVPLQMQAFGDNACNLGRSLSLPISGLLFGPLCQPLSGLGFVQRW